MKLIPPITSRLDADIHQLESAAVASFISARPPLLSLHTQLCVNHDVFVGQSLNIVNETVSLDAILLIDTFSVESIRLRAISLEWVRSSTDSCISDEVQSRVQYSITEDDKLYLETKNRAEPYFMAGKHGYARVTRRLSSSNARSTTVSLEVYHYLIASLQWPFITSKLFCY